MTRKFDVVVAGAGIAGLTCANYLARGGKRVALLEQNDRAGGCMSGFREKGFYFDGGPQSFESMGIVFPILKDLGVYDERGWRRARYRAKSPFFDFTITSLKDTRSKLSEAFPGETGLKPVFDEIDRTSRFLDELGDAWHMPFMENPTPSNILRLLKWVPDLQRWMDPDFKKRLFSRVRREDFRNWLANVGYYHMPFLFLALGWNWWVNDYWYPAGGLQGLMDGLVGKFRELGGEARFQTPVKKILLRDRRVSGVLTGAGEKIEADCVVYAGDYKRLVFDILGERYFEPDFVEKTRRSRVSEALVSVYLGLDIPPEEMKKIMLTRHVMYCPDLNVIFPNRDSEREIHQKAWMEMTSPTLENPGFAPPGKSSLVLQTFSHAEWQDHWGNGNGNGGGSRTGTPEYRELKKAVGMELVKKAEALIPNLSEKIEYIGVGTPLSSIRRTLNTDGASAGWTYDLESLPLAGKYGFVNFWTPVRGLYTAGHYTLWPGGVPGAAFSGKVAAGFILKNPLLGRLDRAFSLIRRLNLNPLVSTFQA